MSKQKILVVDDEQDLCEILTFNLENEGYDVDSANSAEEALTLKLNRYDLLMLDIMMGKMSGFQLAEKVRKERKLQTPIIFLTAKDTENDTLTGFSLGADDYIAKPFSVKQVIARVKAVLKRSGNKGVGSDELIIKDMHIYPREKRVTLNQNSLLFTRKEFDILLLLSHSPRKVFSREEIMANVWEDGVIVSDRTVDVNITRIRKKLGSYGKGLINRSGYGYCFDPDLLK